MYSGVTHMPPNKVPKISTAQDKQAAKRSLDISLIMKVSARVCCNEKGKPSQKDDVFLITGASGPNIIYMCNLIMLPFRDTGVACSICNMSEL